MLTCVTICNPTINVWTHSVNQLMHSSTDSSLHPYQRIRKLTQLDIRNTVCYIDRQLEVSGYKSFPVLSKVILESYK